MAEIDHDAAIAHVRGLARGTDHNHHYIWCVADLAERAKCGTCGGTPPASRKICICNGTGLAVCEAQGLREALYAETERAKRLEEALSECERLCWLAILELAALVEDPNDPDFHIAVPNPAAAESVGKAYVDIAYALKALKF